MKQNIYLSVLLAAMLVIAGCGGGGSGGPVIITGTTMDELAMAVKELEDALEAAEKDATTPTAKQIAAIKREYTELQKAIQEVATGVNTDDAQKLLDGDGTIMSYTERLAAIENKQMAATSTSLGTTSTSTGGNTDIRTDPPAENTPLDNARETLANTLQEWRDRTNRPDQQFIDKIKAAYNAFNILFMDMSNPGNRETANMVNRDYLASFPLIEGMMLAPRMTQSTNLVAIPNNSLVTVEIKNVDGNWQIDTKYGSTNRQFNLGSSFTSGSFWDSQSEEVDINTNKFKYQLESYVHVPAAMEGQDAMPDPSQSLIFGAWVDESISAGMPNHGIQTYQKYPRLSDTRYVSKKAAGTATYSGRAVGILEQDADADGAYIPSYIGQVGTVTLTATFASGANTLHGTISDIHSSDIMLNSQSSPATITSNGVSNGVIGTGANTGTWEAKFVHDGSWIVGDYDWEPNGNAGKTQDADTDGNNYERYKGAFGACTGASCPAP